MVRMMNGHATENENQLPRHLMIAIAVIPLRDTVPGCTNHILSRLQAGAKSLEAARSERHGKQQGVMFEKNALTVLADQRREEEDEDVQRQQWHRQSAAQPAPAEP